MPGLLLLVSTAAVKTRARSGDAVFPVEEGESRHATDLGREIQHFLAGVRAA